MNRETRYTEHETQRSDGRTVRRRMRWRRVFCHPFTGWTCTALEELRGGFWERIA